MHIRAATYMCVWLLLGEGTRATIEERYPLATLSLRYDLNMYLNAPQERWMDAISVKKRTNIRISFIGQSVKN